jgi:hypothetical protein
VAPETTFGAIGPSAGMTHEDPVPDLSRLFHRLNNQLGIILANAELLESRLTDATHHARAGHVVASALDAIATVQEIRRTTGIVEIPTTRPSAS